MKVLQSSHLQKSTVYDFDQQSKLEDENEEFEELQLDIGK